MATNERDMQALELRRAGMAVAAIQERLKFRTRAQAESAIVRALGEQQPSASPASIRQLELDRLDRLQQAVWLQAAKGDLGAIDRVLSLAQARLRIAAMDEKTAGDTPMLIAYQKTIEALGDSVTEADAAVVEIGRRLVARIDGAAGSLDPTADTKALYLTPHLMNVLTLLGATPAARAAVTGTPAGAPTPKEAAKNELEEWRRKRGIGA